MTHTIARLILAMLILPCTGAVFLIGIGIVASFSRGGGPPPVVGVLGLWLGLYLFIFTYWILLWRGVVRWTEARIWKTAGATVVSMLVGVIAAAFGALAIRGIPIQICMMFGGGLVPIVWVLLTVLLWRETAAERVQRLSRAGGGVLCPLCGYNLAGLTEARCPECGSRFTLEQLTASQPQREQQTAEV
jgi:hypothetical protein